LKQTESLNNQNGNAFVSNSDDLTRKSDLSTMIHNNKFLSDNNRNSKHKNSSNNYVGDNSDDEDDYRVSTESKVALWNNQIIPIAM
jgi:hypothetical protein